jgi:subtilisin family serine protease
VAIDAVPRVDLSYSLFKGASFRVDNVSEPDATVNSIARLATVKNLWPVQVHRHPENEIIWVGNEQMTSASAPSRRFNSDSNTTFPPHVMTQVDKLRAAGYTGKGIKIGILDSGVDYNHPALGGCFGPGCLISRGIDFVGDAYNGSNTPIPDNDPMEPCTSSFHGTHVIGTIVAQENPLGFTGAAPDADVGIYKVFGCSGGVASDVLIAAFNQAYEDGNDIITASIGSSSGWSENPIAVALQRIVEKGVPVTVAAGNEGNQGMFFAASGAVGKGVTAIASVENLVATIIVIRATFSVEDSPTEDFGWTEGYPAFANVSLPLYATSNDTAIDDDACNPLPDDTPDLSNYIVLIREATCLISEQGRNVADKGGKYVIMYSALDSVPRPYLNDVSEILGAAGVSREQGLSWVGLINSGKEISLDITEREASPSIVIESPNTRNGGLMSSTTTWGPTWELDVKPNLATVGGGVLSTYPLNLGGYATQSGTSMATPLAAAIYALVAQARGTRDPSELFRVLASTARPTLWAPDKSAGLSSVAQQGAGVAQAYDAVQVKTLLSVSSISFNDTDNILASTRFRIRNLGPTAMTYGIDHVPAVSLYTFDKNHQPARYPNPVASEHAELDFDHAQVVVPAGSSVEVHVTPRPPRGLDSSRLPVYSGYITINGTGTEEDKRARVESLSIPYLGVLGSMNSAPMLNSSLFSMTNLTQQVLPLIPNGTFYLPYPKDFNTPGNSGIGWPFIQFRTNLGTKTVRLDLVADGPNHNTSNRHVDEFGVRVVGSGRGYPLTLVQRFSNSLTFNGMLDDGSVAPEGRYYFLVRVLKIFGDPTKADGWEARAFEPFNLVYTTNASAA